MRFYTQAHQHYCGIDLHARSMYVCILDPGGKVLVHQNIDAVPEALLQLIAAYRDDLVIGVECMFTWYWLADLCARERIRFVLGHALYMRAIHGGKAKNDRIDAYKIAALLKGGELPPRNGRQDHGCERVIHGRARRPFSGESAQRRVGNSRSQKCCTSCSLH